MQRFEIENLLSSADELRRLSRILAAGGVAAIPTESSYGFATNPLDDAGVRRVFEIKGRDDGKPLLVLFAKRSQLAALGVVEDSTLERFFEIWPAPLSVIFRLREPIAASRGAKTLAVRIPAAGRIRALLNETGPLTGTSANRSGESSLDDPCRVEALFGANLDALVDGGVTPGGKPSTLIDATRDPPALLRAGAFAWPPGGS
ncbi:MAG: threonylcarbamoyl-AMP synthase [Acidobacteria bacterium]|nr:threonylcarbamoyl-AMP synthase [Acidobacteriota bacterium]MCA1611671.1 threonylcarbamoyl-AMP synthase [Acidobacteriota bacterium]